MKSLLAKTAFLASLSMIAIASMNAATVPGKWYQDQSGRHFYYDSSGNAHFQDENSQNNTNTNTDTNTTQYPQYQADNTTQQNTWNNPTTNTNSTQTSWGNSRPNTQPNNWTSNQNRFSSDKSAISDNELALSIANAIKNDPTLSVFAQKIQVSAANGQITLTGRVTSIAEKDKVETMVNHMDGVRGITSNLEIRK